MYKIIVALFAAVVLNAEIYDGVAVVIKDRIITLLDIKKEVEQDRVDVKKATDILIRQTLEKIEIENRKITVGSSEVYQDIKQMASRNHLSVSEFYDAVRESNGLTSSELKEKVKQKLLSQKLYGAIAMNSLKEPDEAEIEEYYKLNKKKFQHPVSFSVIIYESKDKQSLIQKTHNPMLYTPNIATNEQVLPYDRISPELASLLTKTPVGRFTPVVPNGRGGFMSFYVQSVKNANEMNLEDIKPQIINAIMEQKREGVLSDYFARLRDNTEINIIRLPEK